MQKMLLYILVLITLSLRCSSEGTNAISYNLNKGRFGDHLITYCKAKWLSYKYNLPLIFKEFHTSSSLWVHTRELLHATPALLASYDSHVTVKHHLPIAVHSATPTLYLVNLQTTTDDAVLLYENVVQHPAFASELKQMLTPCIPVTLIPLPSDQVTVALHVRKGGGYDKISTTPHEPNSNNAHYFADQKFPLKFPPDRFYIDQLIYLSSMLDDQPMYVYLFTDDPNPVALLDTYRNAINKPNITFDCRTTDNRHDSNVIDDYYNMTRFDCLIRPASNFSRAVQLLGNHRITIAPRSARHDNQQVFINKINVYTKDPVTNHFELQIVKVKS